MSARRHRIDGDDLVVVGGRNLRLSKVTRTGLTFDVVGATDSRGRPVRVAFTWGEFAAEVARKGFRRVPRHFVEGRDAAEAEAGVADLSRIPKREVAALLDRLRWTRGFLALEEAGVTNRSDESMAAAIERIAETIAAERAAAAAKGDAKPRKVQFNSRPDADAPDRPLKRPCSKTLLRWVLRYELGGRTAIALRYRHFRSGNRPRRLEPAMVAIVRDAARGYMSAQQPTKATCLMAMKDAVRKLNEARATQGLPALRCPTRRVLSDEIAALPAAMVCAARLGPGKAAGLYGPLGAGLDVRRPGQRIEMDEWVVHAESLLAEKGLLEGLDAAWRETAERHRLVVCEAFDAGFGVTLGLSFSDTDNTVENAIACLAMVFADKTPLARWAGATSRWDMRCSPEEVVTDGGSGFASAEFRAGVTNLLGDGALTPAGVPPLRARIERQFLTREQRLMPLVPGRTFGDVVRKGDYDSHARAALLDVVLRRLIIIDVVDVAHNTPNTGRLKGATPLDAWDEAERTFGVYPPPGAADRRDALGCKVERLTGRHGVRFLGLDYTSEELQRRFRHEGARKAVVSIDPSDLGEVSVLTDDGWLSCPCRQRMMDGTPLDVWVAAEADLRRRHAARARLSEPVVLDAIERMRELVFSAEAQFGLGGARPSAKELERFQSAILISFPPRSAGPDGAPRDPLASAIPRGTPVEPFAVMGGDGPAEAEDEPASDERHEVLDGADDGPADGWIRTEDEADGDGRGPGRATGSEGPSGDVATGGAPNAGSPRPGPDHFTPTIEEHDDDFDDL